MMSSYKLCVLFLLEITSFVNCDYYKNYNTTLRFESYPEEYFKNGFESVTIKHENIPKIISNSLWQLLKVEKLEIENCQVHSVEDGAFGSLLFLKKLSLKHNLLEQITDMFQATSIIQELDLSHNQIRVISSEAFRFSYGLKRINLNNNKIEVFSNKWFDKSPGLSYINLEHNLIKNVPGRVLGYKSHPVDLILSHNPIEEIDKETFSYNQFGKLYLNDIPMKTIPTEAFSQAFCIEDLRVNNKQIVCTKPEMRTVRKYVDYDPWKANCVIGFKGDKIDDKSETSASTTNPSITRRTMLPIIRFG